MEGEEVVKRLAIALAFCHAYEAVWNQWNGIVEWNGGMEYWNDKWPIL